MCGQINGSHCGEATYQPGYGGAFVVGCQCACVHCVRHVCGIHLVSMERNIFRILVRLCTSIFLYTVPQSFGLRRYGFACRLLNSQHAPAEPAEPCQRQWLLQQDKSMHRICCIPHKGPGTPCHGSPSQRWRLVQLQVLPNGDTAHSTAWCTACFSCVTCTFIHGP